jgi:hypothetical protein
MKIQSPAKSRPLLLLAALSLMTAASAAAAVTSISPRRGTVGGGDVVTMTVDTPIPSCPNCSPPSTTINVTFDGVPARSAGGGIGGNNIISAVTPAHATGLVTVNVTAYDFFQAKFIPLGTTTFFFAGVGSLPERSNYEQILIPVLLPAGRVIPGAFGSQWMAELWASNRSTYPAELFSDINCTFTCPPLVPDSPFPQIGAETVTKIAIPEGAGMVGFLYYLQKGAADDVGFSLHISDISRSSQNMGTEVGVVRERDFRTTFDILNVPIDPRSRATLRLYDTDAVEFSAARIDIFTMDGVQIATIQVQLPLPFPRANPELAPVVPPFAGFGQIDDIRTAKYGYPVASLPVASWPARVRLRVKMVNGSRGWGFVSVTNNDTQLITTYRPE